MWVFEVGSPQWRYYRGIGIGNKCLRLALRINRSIRDHPRIVVAMMLAFIFFYTIYHQNYVFDQEEAALMHAWGQ